MPTPAYLRSNPLTLILALGAGFLATGCGVEDGTSCTVTDNGDGTATISCEDGTEAIVENGEDGTNGTNGTNGAPGLDGEDGLTGNPGTDGVDGPPGLPAGETPGLDVSVSLSTPANGTFFVAGEAPVVTLVVEDDHENPLAKSDLATHRLYLNGPREPTKMVAATGLLNASTNRASSTHHYINLLTTTNDNLVVNGNTWTYTLEPITTETAGTYTVAVNSAPNGYPLDAELVSVDLQIGTATPEPSTIVDGCDNCHLGDQNGQYYFHHVDPSSRSLVGSPQYDSDPIASCWACHNTDGYAAVEVCADGSVPHGDDGLCTDGTEDWSYEPDAIIKRVHAIHNGDGLANETNINPDWGLYADYTEVGFPADVRNCTTCHADDAWKTKPSRLACGTCHDDVSFDPAVNHPLAQFNDEGCVNCHTSGTSSASTDIVVAHTVTPPVGLYEVGIALTPPDNDEYYVDEEPDLNLTLTLADGTTAVNWDTVTTTAWNRVYLFVYGPREHSKPVLTNLATNPSVNADPYIDLRMPTGGDTDLRITRTGNVLTYALDDVDGLEPGTYTVLLRLRKGSSENYTWAKGNFQVGTGTEEAIGASECAACHGDKTVMHGYLPFDDVDTCHACHDYALNANSGTSTGWSSNAYGYGRTPISRYVHQFHFGHYLTDTTVPHYDSFEPVIFPQDVRNCTTCHAQTDSWTEEPSRLACTACHDEESTWVHVTLQTLDPTPAQPYSGDEQEACEVCHSGNSEFAPSVVHNISDPYVPPYWREPVE